MKRLILAVGFLSLSSLAMASVQTPKDDRGNTIPTVDFVGANPYYINSATGTGVCLVATGRAVVYGVIVSSIPYNADYLVLRDSATANTTSSTAAVVYPFGAQPVPYANASANVFGTTATTELIKFPVPLKFTNGISANLSVAPVNSVSGWTIIWRPLAAGE